MTGNDEPCKWAFEVPISNIFMVFTILKTQKVYFRFDNNWNCAEFRSVYLHWCRLMKGSLLTRKQTTPLTHYLSIYHIELFWNFKFCLVVIRTWRYRLLIYHYLQCIPKFFKSVISDNLAGKNLGPNLANTVSW